MTQRTMDRPTLRTSLVSGIVEPEQVFLLTETKHFILMGKAYRALAPLLDGTRTTDEVLQEAFSEINPPEALYAFQQLIRKGYVLEAAHPELPSGQVAWWDAVGVHAATATERLKDTVVTLSALGDQMDAAQRAVGEALGSAGIVVRQGSVGADPAGTEGLTAPSVVLCADPLDPALADVDAAHRAAGRPWLLAKPVGTLLWLGPVFVPGETGCWNCLAQRLHGNRQVERYLARHQGGLMPTTALARGRAPLGHAAHAVATAIESWVLKGTPPARFVGRIRTTDLTTWRVEEHELVRRPQCPTCGDPELRNPRRSPPPLALTSVTKLFTNEGGHRSLHPSYTLDRMQRHVSPITGIVSSLIRKEPADNYQSFSYASGHDFVHQGHDVEALRGNLRFRSGGKGVTDLQARVSAICEAVERWSGVWRDDEARVTASARDLGDDALSLEAVLGFSSAQMENRTEWNAACSSTGFHLVPKPFDPDLVVDWVYADEVGGTGRKLLPAAFAYYGHPDSRHMFCNPDANGTAAGNTLEEAVLQGFMELAERDAVAVWWYNRLRRPAVDLSSFTNPWVEEMVRFHHDLGRELWVLDLTHDLGIPVFAGISRKVGGPSEDIIASFGAHFDPSIALTRAISEVNQFLPAVAGRNPDGTTRYAYDDPDAISWWSEATVASEPYLAPSDATPRGMGDFGYVPRPDILDDVKTCVAAAAAAGMETYVVDQSRPDADLKVVRVVVPGIRHFWRRLGPGRLQEVPVRLGWLSEPTPEAEMNPISMFF